MEGRMKSKIKNISKEQLPETRDEVDGLLDSNTKPKATAPTSFTAWVIPANGGEPQVQEFGTIEVPISRPAPFGDLDPATDVLASYLRMASRRAGLVFHLAEPVGKGGQEGVQEGTHEGMDEGEHELKGADVDNKRLDVSVFQPDILRLPDTRSIWLAEGWAKRAAQDMGEGFHQKCGGQTMDGYHLFYTLAKGGPLMPNKHSNNQIYGDMFLLKVSDAEEEDGRLFYVNVDSDIIWEDDRLPTFRNQMYYGLPEIEAHSTMAETFT